jgi:hypothetical protein
LKQMNKFFKKHLKNNDFIKNILSPINDAPVLPFNFTYKNGQQAGAA